MTCPACKGQLEWLFTHHYRCVDCNRGWNTGKDQKNERN